MTIFEFDNYKDAIKAKVKEAKSHGKPLTLRAVAEKLRIQYTYLSKVLNDEKAHLSEDHLFEVGQLLGLLPDEIDYLGLLRSLAMTQHASRKNFLLNKLNVYRKRQQVSAEIREFSPQGVNEEIHYLFDPYCVVVHVALLLPEYQEHPRRLCSVLGLSPERLQITLSRLQALDFVELDESGNVKKVTKSRIHYGTDHPLMRAHQQIFSGLCQTHLQRVEENKKHRFMTTFTASESTFRFVAEKLGEVIKEAQKHSRDFTSDHVYQLNYELFRWL